MRAADRLSQVVPKGCCAPWTDSRPRILARGLPLILLGGLCALGLVAGCAGTSSGGHHRRDSTLSQASKEAEKKLKDQKKLPVTHDEDGSENEPDDQTVKHDHDTGDRGASDQALSRDDEPSRKHVGVVFGSGSFGGGAFHNFSMLGLQAGGYANEWVRLDFTGMYRDLSLYRRAGTGGLDNPGELMLDITARGYLTPGHTFVGAYGLAGVRLGWMWWDYRNPIRVVEEHETRTVESDAIGAWGVFTGIGISPVQFRHLHLGFNLTGGMQAFGQETSEGFDNDLLPVQGFLQLMMELSILGR